MTRMKILGAAAILASMLASPAMAQQVQNMGPGNPSTGSFQRQAYRQNGNLPNSYNRWDGRGSFRAGDVAAGGAVGTAATVSTAPIGGEEYARRNGFVCIPGTLFRGEDGRRHPCQ
jgi:hypothetical protein